MKCRWFPMFLILVLFLVGCDSEAGQISSAMPETTTPAEPFTPPEDWHIVYNDMAPTLALDFWTYDKEFSLPESWLETCIPDMTMDWMNFSGIVAYGHNHLFHSVHLELPSQRGEHTLTITLTEGGSDMRELTDEWIQAAYHVMDRPAHGFHDVYMVLACEAMTISHFGAFRFPAGQYTDEATGNIQLSCWFSVEGESICVFTEVPPEAVEAAKADLFDVMVCYARTETFPDLRGYDYTSYRREAGILPPQ